jgi:hypothetical protein
LTAADFLASTEQLDAWRDADLGRYFTPTDSVSALADPASRRVLAVGLKGIGKTATFRFLTQFDRSQDVTVGIHRKNYSVYLPPGRLNHAACQRQFEHDLVVEALRAVAEAKPSLARLDGALLKRAQNQVSSYREAVRKLATRVSGISILGCGFNIHQDDSTPLVGLRREEDVQAAFEVLRELVGAGVRIRIVIDDPELVFLAGPHLDTHLLGGLFLAAHELSDELPGLKIVILIKTHVYSPIVHEIADLVDKHPRGVVRLSWTGSELAQVLVNRLRWAEAQWDEVFDGDRGELVEYLLGRLRSGPRELLHWIGLAADRTGGGRIDHAAFEACRPEMAAYSLNTLGAAFSESYPEAIRVLQQLFRGDRDRRFTPGELVEHIEKLKVSDPALRSLWTMDWLSTHTPRTLLGVLFETGSVALESGGELILPFDRRNDPDHYQRADRLLMTPALIEAI